MARRTRRPPPTKHQSLQPLQERCPECGGRMWADYKDHRTVTTLGEVLRLTLQIRRCANPGCGRYHRPYRPEEEGGIALPHHEFGLDVMALVGALRYQQHRSVPEIHEELEGRGVALSERTVTNLLDRYDELVALSVADTQRLRGITGTKGRVILGLDGLQPDVGHEVLWVLRDCISGQVLVARSLLASTQEDLGPLIEEVKKALEVPIVGVISDGQSSIRRAVQKALAGVPHQLCQFHYLRDAVGPIAEADRHAKKELKKRVRGIRKIERKVEDRQEPQASATLGYCAAVRSALTDDGRPPLGAPGLKLKERLGAVAESLQRVEAKKGPFRRSWDG